MPFGIFNSFWDDHPNHLPLLGLSINSSNTERINLDKSLKKLIKSLLIIHSKKFMKMAVRY